MFYLDASSNQQMINTSLPNTQSVLALPPDPSNPIEAFRLLVGGNTVYDSTGQYLGGQAALHLYSISLIRALLSSPQEHHTD